MIRKYKAEPKPAESSISKRKQTQKANSKATRIEFQRRVDAVLELLISGTREVRICQIVSKKYDVTPRTVYRYLKKAKEQLADAVDTNRDTLISRHLALRERIIEKALSENDLRTALRSSESIAKLIGLNAPERSELTGKGGAPIEVATMSATELGDLMQKRYEAAMKGETPPPNPSNE